MVGYWESDEYSHSYLVPFVALYIAWYNRANAITKLLAQDPSQLQKQRLFGIPILLAALFLLVVGEMSTIYIFIQYGFILALFSVAVSIVGTSAAFQFRNSFIYLLFMIPIPNLILNNLSNSLRLVSSELGVELLRLVGVSVFLEGNVIDLGLYQLEVADACNGLRYLFPLISFSFLVTCFYKRGWLIKGLVILSALPITILMNSFRIAVIGITVDNWGIEMAEGFIHFFEGWVVFIACLALLALEVWCIERLFFKQTRVSYALDLNPAEPMGLSNTQISELKSAASSPLLIVTVILLGAVAFTLNLEERAENVPSRTDFDAFPLYHSGWVGREEGLSNSVKNALKATDYYIADYVKGDRSTPVNLYIAYYESQRKGASIHSPKSCIPGDGWEIQSLETISQLPQSITVDGVEKNLPHAVNRAIIQRGRSQNLVYYWFQQRGRTITNEYWAKFYIVKDSITKSRTDGALIRVITPIKNDEDIANADARMLEYIQSFDPLWREFIPN